MKTFRNHSKFLLLLPLIYVALNIFGTHIHSFCPGDCGSGQVEHQHENHCDQEQSSNHGHATDQLHECCPEVPHTHAISVPHLSKNSHDFLNGMSRPAKVTFFKNPFQQSVISVSFRFGSVLPSFYFPELNVLRI